MFRGLLTLSLTRPCFFRKESIMKTEFFDKMILYIFGEPDLCRTIGNLIWGGQYVSDEQIRKQMLSLSTRLSDDMDPAKWPEFLRRVRSNVGIRLQREKQAEQENLAFMKAELKRMEAGNEGNDD